MKTQLLPPVSTSDYGQGNPNAGVILVEFGDYQCPHCAAAHHTVRELQDKFGPELRFVFRDFPLSNHHDALYMAMCTRAAGRQHKYWEMHNLIFDNQQTFPKYPIRMLAKLLSIDEIMFSADMKDPVIKQEIEKDYNSGLKSGVTKVPAFFINGVKYIMGNSYSELHNAIDMKITR